MNIVPLLVAFSLFLAVCGLLLFVYSTRNRDHEHADRLSLLPLEDDAPPATGTGGAESQTDAAGDTGVAGAADDRTSQPPAHETDATGTRHP